MKSIIFATGNVEKTAMAKTICEPLGINLEQVNIDIDEIQGEDSDKIIRDKVIKAFEVVKSPVIVSDDSWSIKSLNGFPGPYMKSINEWFSPQDFLNLMKDKKDRSITYIQYLAYMDESVIKIFSNQMPGVVLEQPRGVNKNSPNMTVTVLDADKGRTVAEVFELGPKAIAERYNNTRDVWHEFAEWYSNNS